MEDKRTTVYLKPDDRQRLKRLRNRYGLGVSAATRAGLALLENQLIRKGKTMLIETGFHGADLFIGDGFENVDQVASAELYAKLLEKALQDAFPGVEVVVSYDMDASGVLPYNLCTRIDDMYDDLADPFDTSLIAQCHADVYETFDWVVEKAD